MVCIARKREEAKEGKDMRGKGRSWEVKGGRQG